MKQKNVVKFGAINAPKPQWATWLFRSVAILTTVASFWIGSTTLLKEHVKVEVVLALKAIDMLVLGLSNLFGIIIPEETTNN
ncbi:hypothetical protein ACFQZX_03960 [Mucilaginibacter litoreus]|uniref:Uncharacterized protein n=1 Tax=Mucilaginibacter litoreus TaxID=1048221 RepID=A0ABW3APJ1_9SPHI